MNRVRNAVKNSIQIQIQSNKDKDGALVFCVLWLSVLAQYEHIDRSCCVQMLR